MSKVLKVSRSGYYQFLNAKPSQCAIEDKKLLFKIQAIHQASRQTDGSLRICAELHEEGEICLRKRVSRIMKKSGIIAKMKKRFKVMTRANSKASVAPNLLKQDFSTQRHQRLGSRFYVGGNSRGLVVCSGSAGFIFSSYCWVSHE